MALEIFNSRFWEGAFWLDRVDGTFLFCIASGLHSLVLIRLSRLVLPSVDFFDVMLAEDTRLGPVRERDLGVGRGDGVREFGDRGTTEEPELKLSDLLFAGEPA